MASVESDPITRVWGLCPKWGPWADPLVRGAKPFPPETEHFLCCHIPEMAQAAMFMSCFMVINGSCSTNMCARAMATTSTFICVTRQLSFIFFLSMAPCFPSVHPCEDGFIAGVVMG